VDGNRFDQFTRIVATSRSRRGLFGSIAALAVGAIARGIEATAQDGPSAPAGATPCLSYLFGSGSATGGKSVSFRVRLTAPAPSGGARVSLSSASPALPMPATVTVPEGALELTFRVTTAPVAIDTRVTVTAAAGGCTRSRVVLVRAPRLRSLSAQSVMRGGGQGKVTVCLTGRAPAGGISINVTSNRPSVLFLPGPVTISPGSGCRSLIVEVADVSRDVPVVVTARYDGATRSDGTIVRDLSSEPPATATPTNTPTATNTPTSTSTPTATSTSTPLPCPTCYTLVGGVCVRDPNAPPNGRCPCGFAEENGQCVKDQCFDCFENIGGICVPEANPPRTDGGLCACGFMLVSGICVPRYPLP
jgi:hypothetical protein